MESGDNPTEINLNKAKKLCLPYQNNLYTYLLLFNPSIPAASNLFTQLLTDMVKQFSRKKFKEHFFVNLFKQAHLKSQPSATGAKRITNELEEKLVDLPTEQKEILFFKEKMTIPWDKISTILQKTEEELKILLREALINLQNDESGLKPFKKECILIHDKVSHYLYCSQSDPIRVLFRKHCSTCRTCRTKVKNFQQTLLDITDWLVEKPPQSLMESTTREMAIIMDSQKKKTFPWIPILSFIAVGIVATSLFISIKNGKNKPTSNQNETINEKASSNKKASNKEAKNKSATASLSQNKITEKPQDHSEILDNNKKKNKKEKSSSSKNSYKNEPQIEKKRIAEVVGVKNNENEVQEEITKTIHRHKKMEFESLKNKAIFQELRERFNGERKSGATFNPRAEFEIKKSKGTPDQEVIGTKKSIAQLTGSNKIPLPPENPPTDGSITLNDQGHEVGTFTDESFGFLESEGGVPPAKKDELTYLLNKLPMERIAPHFDKLKDENNKEFIDQLIQNLQSEEKEMDFQLTDELPSIECGENSQDPVASFFNNVTQTAEKLGMTDLDNLSIQITFDPITFKMHWPIVSYILEKKISEKYPEIRFDKDAFTFNRLGNVSPVFSQVNSSSYGQAPPSTQPASANGSGQIFAGQSSRGNNSIALSTPYNQDWVHTVRLVRVLPKGAQTIYLKFRDALLNENDDTGILPEELNYCPAPIALDQNQ